MLELKVYTTVSGISQTVKKKKIQYKKMFISTFRKLGRGIVQRHSMYLPSMLCGPRLKRVNLQEKKQEIL